MKRLWPSGHLAISQAVASIPLFGMSLVYQPTVMDHRFGVNKILFGLTNKEMFSIIKSANHGDTAPMLPEPRRAATLGS